MPQLKLQEPTYSLMLGRSRFSKLELRKLFGLLRKFRPYLSKSKQLVQILKAPFLPRTAHLPDLEI